ncbi:MAG: flagellar basal-body MS-ring/collar protein FliF [Rickettsiales bacterium]
MDFLKNLSPIKLIAIAAGGIAVLLMLLFLTMKLASAPLSTLYSDLSPDDSGMIIARLDSMGIRYEVQDEGKTVLVPSGKVLSLRMNFAQEGIPNTGSIVGYEIFDKSEAMGTSQFVHNVNLVRALEGELARTIGNLQTIENARVHLVLPRKEMFSKVGSEPTASVVLRMRGAQSLTKPEVTAITHLVATAVPGLKPDNVTIVDNRGKALKLGATPEGDAAALTENSAEYQRAVEERLQKTVEDLLERSVGVGKVRATIAAEINFDREVINSEIYDPDGQVLRSKRTSEDNDSEREASSNALGVATNLPGGQAAGGGGGQAGRTKNRTDEVNNYEISKTITNKISESGRIKKLSIAILVDGTYKIEDAKDGSEPKTIYSPRTEEELTKIKALASSAIGIDPKRGDVIEVINMQFSDEFVAVPQKEKPFDWLKNELETIVQTVVIGVVIIMLILLVVRPILIRTLESRRQTAAEPELHDVIATMQEAAATRHQQAEEVEMVDLTVGEDKRKANMLKQVNEIVEKHPEETVSILRNWLYSSE